jgi:hypothetical protein
LEIIGKNKKQSETIGSNQKGSARTRNNQKKKKIGKEKRRAENTETQLLLQRRKEQSGFHITSVAAKIDAIWSSCEQKLKGLAGWSDCNTSFGLDHWMADVVGLYQGLNGE